MKFKKSFTLFLIVSLIISMQTLSVSGDQTPGALVVGSDELVTGISEISTEVPLEAPIQETTESVSSEALDEKKELPKRYIISYNTEYPSNPVINPATNSPQNALAIRSLKNTAGSRNVLNAHSEVVEFSSDDDIQANLDLIMNDPRVSMVEEDKVRYLANTPNDPYYSSQWSLPNIQATEAWQQIGTLNKSIKVAVIDTGVDADHPDLAGRIASGGKGFNYSISSNNSVASDDFNDVLGHGTMVAGVIVANTHNSIGVAGVSGNLDVKILPIKVFWGSDPLKATCYTSDIIAAIDYAISQGVDVINMSLGAIGYIEAENLAVQRAINAGITVVASAGNDGNTSDAGKYEYPASYNNVISVGSINSSNAKSVFSSYNDKVSVVAPGEGIVTTEKNSGYSYPSAVNGTSFSAPVVSAIAAVLKGENPSAAPSQIKTTIQSSAIDLGTVGYDVYYGYGKVNFLNAVTSPLVEDGSTGIIDSVILDVYSKKIFMPMAGVSDIIGYADVLSKENVQDSVYQKVYQYLKANHQTPLIFGISSGTKTMVMDGENGYAMYYYLTPTVADAMQATLAVSESVYNACYTFHGLDAGGNGILMPIAVSLSSIAGVVVETGTDVNSAVYHNVYLPFAGVQAQFPIISSANTMTIQISGSANIVYEAVYSTGLPLDEVTNGWAAYCISGVTREQVMQGIVKVR